jgi:hypothetical protein
MRTFYKKLIQLIQLPKDQSLLFTTFWTGAFSGLLLLVGTIAFLSGFFFQTGIPKVLIGIAMLLLGILVFWICRLLMAWLHRSILRIPMSVFSLIFGALITLVIAKEIRFRLDDIIFYPGIMMVMLCLVLVFGSSWVLIKRASTSLWLHRFLILFSVVILGSITYFLSQEGNDPYPLEFEPTPASLLSAEGVKNPGEKGTYSFSYFTYGSGTDRRRDEFGKGITHKTQSVDASPLLAEWKESKAKWRERFWGFGVKEFPLNGRVWMPQGDGKFPMVFIVHGNHGMEEFSDPGYAYLGELLASRGFIMVSVDENFLNATWSGDFMGKEMPARAWLLLKHVEQWKNWSADPSSTLYNKADIQNVILAGHSRGGEAAPIAAHYNTLEYFPDNANAKFDFHFGIKGVISIAPTDKRYTRRIQLTDVNYLSLQGSYDSDEASFFGFRQYQRIKFADSSFYFKSGVYIHRANHGQFNSAWGRIDGGPPNSWLLNIKPLITQDEQQQIAKVYISAFAEAVLHNDLKYLSTFKNSYSVADWLPKATILNTYADSKTQLIANFEEDIDLTSGSTKNVILLGEQLKVWREETLLFRDKDTQGNNALVLGWVTLHDSTKQKPQYQLSFLKPIDLNSTDALFISIALGDPSDLKNENSETKKPERKDVPINFTIQLEDSLGRQVQVELNSIKKLAPRLKVQFEKLNLLQEDYGSTWEPTFETLEISWTEFENTSQSLRNIKHIRFVFDRTPHGVIILDDIGLGKEANR